MAIVSIPVVGAASSRNPDDSLIGRLRVTVLVNDVTLAMTTVVCRNTTGERHRVRLLGHDIDVPHDPLDADQVTDTSGLGLLLLLTPRGLRPSFRY